MPLGREHALRKGRAINQAGLVREKSGPNKLAFMLAIAICIVCASSSALAGDSCTITSATIVPLISSCSGSTWVINVTTTGGEHPGTQELSSDAAPAKGVCQYDYPSCSTNDNFDVVEQLPSASIKSKAVNTSTGEITIILAVVEPTETASTAVCKCSDPNPQGYTNIVQGSQSVPNETFYGQC
jgi:hypothetical protein